MGKVLTLLFIIALALLSWSGYLFLTEKISAGARQIAAGQKRLEEGQQMLEQGKARLAHGKHMMTPANTVYSVVNGIPFVSGVAEKLPVTGTVFNAASKEIAQGDLQIAQGELKVKAGQGQLAAGKLALSRGQQRLTLANSLRLACVLGAAFFSSLALMLGLYWRRALVKVFRQAKT